MDNNTNSWNNDPQNFDYLKISVASPQRIRSWSFGEVTKPETINYRTFKPEKDGLFCSKIFGPVKDYECLCGKYKRMRYKGVVCEKCGVEVTVSRVRRDRMGHIELAAPVAHIWFLKSLPSRISLLVDLPLKSVESVLYFDKYIVIEPGLTSLKRNQLLSEDEYITAKDEFGEDSFNVGIGAQGIKEILSEMNLEEDIERYKEDLNNTNSEIKYKILVKKIKLIQSLINSNTRPEWLILDVIPVIPPDLRPLVPLDGGRFATSDLNDLYRRVINRNNRLKRLKELFAPDIIIRNEMRMLQESVDALFDNGRRGRVINGTNRRPLKSLSDMLKGKQGRFRQNLLGKRVDYSGRSVIVVGPDLMLHQCGIPKKMALELFKPFILSKLEKYGIAPTIKAAKKMIEKERSEVWQILDEVIREHPVLVNRAPTLHRLGIQAFEPKLIEGKAISLHPLVCSAFNADFDGDQMAVHLPLSLEAQLEARVLMMSTNNILSPSNGEPIIVPSQDIILGLYYLSMDNHKLHTMPYKVSSLDILEAGIKSGDLAVMQGVNEIESDNYKELFDKIQSGEYKLFRVPSFNNIDEIQHALNSGDVEIHTPIKTFYNYTSETGEETKIKFKTTVGRCFIFEILPKNPRITLDDINIVYTKKNLQKIIGKVYRFCGPKSTIIFCDKLMGLGFKWACKAGISFGKDDMVVPDERKTILESAEETVLGLENQYLDGLITKTEKYNKVIDVWTAATEDIADAMMTEMSKVDEEYGYNSVYMMADSGARGSIAQMKQLAGIRGLMAKPSGEIIETPIKSNFKQGLSVIEYFTSAHGARKGLADTALKTANSGYLTRRLVDVAQDVVVVEDDCGTENYITLKNIIENGNVIDTAVNKATGRFIAEDIEVDGKTIIAKDEFLNDDIAVELAELEVDEIKVYSPITCGCKVGICKKCYGRDLARGKIVNTGEVVGIVSAQSIGEPGTQLTMRTFHVGGVAQGAKVNSSLVSDFAGTIEIVNESLVQNSSGDYIVMNNNTEISVVDKNGSVKLKSKLVYGSKLYKMMGDKVEIGDLISDWDPFTKPIISDVSGKVDFSSFEENITYEVRVDENTGVSTKVVIANKFGSENPVVNILDDSGNKVILSNGYNAKYMLPENSVISVENGAVINAGDVICKIPMDVSKTKDITGGLPRVAELFEARRPKDPAILADIDGTFEYVKEYKSKRKVLIRSSVEGVNDVEYLVSKSSILLINEGETVKKGDVIVDGQLVSHDILSLFGVEKLAEYIVNEVQSVYKLQGVMINDKHIEVIVRQMLKKVEITDPGDTLLVQGEEIDFVELNEINEALGEGKKPAEFKRILLGITKSSLNNRSFISSASFQETTKILTEAAIAGKEDWLVGLKENVIVGRLIPSGTGFVLNNLRDKARKLDS